MAEALIPEGYIVIARVIRKSATWQSLNAAHRIVMIELLLQAQHTAQFVSRNGEKIWLEKGQVATSYQQLVNDINASDVTFKKVRDAIEKLEKLEFLAKDKAKARAKKGLLLTVVNWEFYQCQKNYEGNVKGKETGNVRAKHGQSMGNVRAINKNVKNVKNEKNDNNILFPEEEIETEKEIKIEPIPFKEIISYLNEKAGTKYRYKGETNRKHIQARWNDGFILQNFYTVIDKKVAEWINTEHEKYLRPETLFGPKFEGYLNQKIIPKTAAGDYSNAEGYKDGPEW